MPRQRQGITQAGKASQRPSRDPKILLRAAPRTGNSLQTSHVTALTVGSASYCQPQRQRCPRVRRCDSSRPPCTIVILSYGPLWGEKAGMTWGASTHSEASQAARAGASQSFRRASSGARSRGTRPGRPRTQASFDSAPRRHGRFLARASAEARRSGCLRYPSEPRFLPALKTGGLESRCDIGDTGPDHRVAP